MDEEAQDDYFDDADFDNLPPNTLQELEQKAFSSTQRNVTAPLQPPNLETNDCGNASPSSDYGLDDEDVVDLDAQDNSLAARFPRSAPPQPLDPATEREQWRRQRYADPSKIGTVPQAQPLQTNGKLSTHRHGLAQATASHRKVANNVVDVDAAAVDAKEDVKALQARIVELEQEQASLRQLNQEARSAAISKTGEIAIVRANQDKVAKDYERRMSELQQRHTDELARQKVELEISRRDREKVETSNRFLEHDLAQEAERARNARRTLKDRHGNATQARPQPSPLTTPKKTKSLPFRDGFNDDEVVMISPSKGKDRSKPSTPSAGAKRKRGSVQRSPSKPLSFNENDRMMDENDMGMTPLDVSDQVPAASDPIQKPSQNDIKNEAKFEFFDFVLNDFSDTDGQRIMEIMAHRAFPSDPSTSFSSLVHECLSFKPFTIDEDDYRLLFCNRLMYLWERSLDEQYYDAIHELTEYLHHIVLMSPSYMSPLITPQLVPLCQRTADLVALPTAKAFRNPSHSPTPISVKCQIRPSQCLELLHLVALNCDTHPGAVTALWSAIEFDFILLMLHKSQPITQIIMTLHLLATSVLPTSFGAIMVSTSSKSDQASRQVKSESDILDRLTVLLFEVPGTKPRPQSVKSAYSSNDSNTAIADDLPTPTELLHLRASVLALLKRLCFTHHGGATLAVHRFAAGRLIRFLHAQTDALYKYDSSNHDLTAGLLNESVMILAHLTACHSDVLDLRSRLAAVPGGPELYLVGLSRVAFAEGASVIERGIAGEACDEAHRMLDVWLSPEEGDAVVGVYCSGR